MKEPINLRCMNRMKLKQDIKMKYLKIEAIEGKT